MYNNKYYYFIYNSQCQDYSVTIGPCDSTASSDPIIVNYDGITKYYGFDDITITIDTSKANDNKVCLKFSRVGKTDVMMSEPFYL